MTKNSSFNTYITELFKKNNDARVNDLLPETVDDIFRNIEAYDPHKIMLNDFFFSVKESLYHHFHHVSADIEVSEDETSVEVTDDAEPILSKVNTFDGAFEQIFIPKKVAEDEIPVLFLGFAMQNRFNSDDKSYIGFFISDQAVYMVDDFSFFHSDQVFASSSLIPRIQTLVPSFVDLLTGRFKAWDDWASLAMKPVETVQATIRILLISILQTIVVSNTEANTWKTIAIKKIDADTYIRHNALETQLIMGSHVGPQKKIQKIIKKFNIPDTETVHLVFVSFALFFLPWGMAITNKAVYSKDLFENTLRLSLEDINEDSLCYSEDGAEIRINEVFPVFFPKDAVKASGGTELLAFLKQELTLMKKRVLQGRSEYENIQ